MQAIIDACREGRLDAEVALVVSASPGAPALARAEAAGVPARLIAAAAYPSREEHERALAQAMTDAGVDLVCLAGYMRLLGREFLSRFPSRVLNIHPSLLPAFGGQGFYGHHVHEAVISAGVTETGVTVFLVDEEYDRGPILLQRRVPVHPGDTANELAARVLVEEHRVYPEAIALYAAQLSPS